MIKIVGIKHHVGEYQGRAYDNYVIHTIQSDDKAVGGVSTETYKFRPASLAAICSLDQLSMLVNKEVKRISFDKYGNADYIDFA